MNENIIAIDGPAGSGKSSVAKDVAESKGYYYMDSGAYYRAVTVFFMRKCGGSENFSSWMQKGKWTPFLGEILLNTFFVGTQENRTYLNGENVSGTIRTPQVTEEIKHVAAIPEIRKLVNLNLHDLSRMHKLVMDGRDIGTEVFPDAKYKFFLTASADVRAKRRFLELEQKGMSVDFETLKADIIRRDESDMNREIAPLKQAEDAIFLDTSSMSREEVKNKILEYLNI